MFSEVFVCPQWGLGLCPGGLCLGVSVQGVCVCGGGISVQEISIQGVSVRDIPQKKYWTKAARKEVTSYKETPPPMDRMTDLAPNLVCGQ